MIIDTHLHESEFSKDSFISFNEAILTAKKIGLDGICVTDHESNGLINTYGSFFVKDGITVIVGAEILTYEGDILAFGLKNIPTKKLHAKELLTLIKENNGVSICAHPYRNNNRGLGDNIKILYNLLDGVETFNGSTTPHANLYAYANALEFNLGCFGAGDSHVTEKIGCYATEFKDYIKSEQDFLNAVRNKNYCPVIRKENKFERINIYNTLK